MPKHKRILPAAATTLTSRPCHLAAIPLIQKELKHKGRPMRTKPYILPPLPAKRVTPPTRKMVEQRQARSVLQNNAASLRYRRRQADRRLQKEATLKDLYLTKAQLLAKEAKLKKGIQTLNQHIWQQASQGCGECLQTSLLIQTPSFPLNHPMVKIEMSDLEEVKVCPLQK